MGNKINIKLLDGTDKAKAQKVKPSHLFHPLLHNSWIQLCYYYQESH